ncbi:MAG: Gfo/Idh/MocA family oxidoreductase [Spirochaetes bacterium]|nr:Gfo/Idh/MocA family oxidoreductase [Spirochaetota bacterium]
MKQKKSGPITIGIAGIGRAGWGMHCNELKGHESKFTIVAACDIDKTRTARMKERYNAAAYADFDAMIKDDAVELVDIATLSPDHTPMALRALAAGKYVFLEKPIALTYKDALKLKAASKKYPGKLFFRHNRRFETPFVHIREIIASGMLGNVYEVKLRRHGYSRRDDWQTIISSGGGQLNNWGPHIIDHALRFLNSPVKSIWGDLKKVAAVGDAEDHLKIVLTGTNGCIVDLEISGGAAICEPEYIIFGTKGALTCTGNEIKMKYLDPSVKLLPRKAIKQSPPMEGSFGNPDNLVWKEETVTASPKVPSDTSHIWDHLYAAIREGKKFPVTIDEGVEVVRVADFVKRGTVFAKKRQ